MTTYPYWLGPPFAAKTALTGQGMDSTRFLKVCCAILHQAIISRFWKSCKLRGGTSMDLTCFSITSHRHSVGLWPGKFGGQVNTNFLLCSSNYSWTIFALSCWKRVTCLQLCSCICNKLWCTTILGIWATVPLPLDWTTLASLCSLHASVSHDPVTSSLVKLPWTTFGKAWPL